MAAFENLIRSFFFVTINLWESGRLTPAEQVKGGGCVLHYRGGYKWSLLCCRAHRSTLLKLAMYLAICRLPAELS